ncbi:hypothetical protein D3C81_1883590 [compost metagenome]
MPWESRLKNSSFKSRINSSQRRANAEAGTRAVISFKLEGVMPACSSKPSTRSGCARNP